MNPQGFMAFLEYYAFSPKTDKTAHCSEHHWRPYPEAKDGARYHIGIDPTTLSRLERNKRQRSFKKIMGKVADFLEPKD